MSFLGFGKKKNEFEDLEKELGLPEEAKSGLPEPAEMPAHSMEEPEKPAFKEEGFKEEPMEFKELPKEEHLPKKDLELISAKLDAIRLMIDNMDQRIKHIEKMEEEGVKRRRTW